MQCGDCHFDVDVHGNGLLYGEPRNATTITCVDCHGTVNARPTLITSGSSGHFDPTSPTKTAPVDSHLSVTAWKPRFEWLGLEGPGTPTLIQNSSMSPNIWWEVPQTIDVITPGSKALQRQSTLCEDAAARWRRVGRRQDEPGRMRAETRAQQCKHGLPGLPQLVGDELLRLPSADESESAHRLRIRRKARSIGTS